MNSGKNIQDYLFENGLILQEEKEGINKDKEGFNENIWYNAFRLFCVANKSEDKLKFVNDLTKVIQADSNLRYNTKEILEANPELKIIYNQIGSEESSAWMHNKMLYAGKLLIDRENKKR